MNAEGIRQGIYRNALARLIAQWLDAVPHPPVVCEITPEYVAAVRWTRSGTSVESVAVEPIPAGAITPTAVETNLLDPSAVRSAVSRVFSRLHTKGQAAA